MSEWKECKIKDITSKITSGGTPKSSEAKYYDGIIPWLNTKEINFNRIAKTERCITEEGYNNSSAKWIPKGSVIVAMYGATAAKVAYTQIDLTTNQACCNLIIDDNKADSQFVYYYIQSSYEELLNLACGAAQQNLSVGVIADFPIFLPSLDEQKRIAFILSSLDDKIDLLNRENATLEAMAETLFRQWFIEEAKEDWEDKPLSAYGKIVCGKTPPKKETKYFGGAIPFIKIPDMHGRVFVFSSEDSLTEEGKMFQKEKTLPSGSIIVSCIATVGLVALNAKDSQTNQQINSIIPYKDEYRYFLFLHLRNMHDELNAMASGGTATLNLNTNNFSNIRIACPNIEMLTKFNQHVEPLFDKIFCNQKQIISLTKQRQELLPKLMSNEINV